MMKTVRAKWEARQDEAKRRGGGGGPSAVARRARAERRLIEEFLLDLANLCDES